MASVCFELFSTNWWVQKQLWCFVAVLTAGSYHKTGRGHGQNCRSGKAVLWVRNEVTWAKKMPLQKVNKTTSKGWPCALKALQCHLPSLPALVDVQCHLAGKTVVYSRKVMSKAGRKSSNKKQKSVIRGTKQTIQDRECHPRVCVTKQSECEG